MCWPAASLSGTGTAVLLTVRPSSGQWTWLQRSSVPLSHPSWTFFLHDAPAKPTASWRTPPTPPTVSSSSYHQEDGTGASEPAPPDCSTAFSPRLWEPWTQITPPPSETPCKTLPPETFTSLLYVCIYVCIYVAPWTREARHFVPLYVPTCSGMTIKLNLTWMWTQFTTKMMLE